jgi:hypothetical protein
MGTYSVLLKTWKPIPHMEIGKELSDLIGVHLQDAYMHLRRQQGIIWEGLDEYDANKLGSFLIGKGYQAGLVPDEYVVKLGRPTQIRNADPVPGGFEMEDFHGQKTLIEGGRISLAQAGWVEEKVEHSPRQSTNASVPTYGEYSDHWIMNRADSHLRSEQITTGWVLHLFMKGEPVEWYRVVGSHFVYDYQKIPVIKREDRFGILLEDLAKVLPYECLGPVYRMCMGNTSIPAKEGAYDTLSEMTDRARWILTMKKLEA